MNLLLVGYGKMGRLVEQLAVEQGDSIAGRVDLDGQGWARGRRRDRLLDRRRACRKLRPLRRVGAAGRHRDDRLVGARRRPCEPKPRRARLGVVASANFSIGVNLFELMVAEAARLMEPHQQYGAWIHEQHHAAKRDAPSGTALLLRDAMTGAGFTRPIDMASTRAGMIPGTHTIGFDGPSDTIELTHSGARSTRLRERGAAGGPMDPGTRGVVLHGRRITAAVRFTQGGEPVVARRAERAGRHCSNQPPLGWC